MPRTSVFAARELLNDDTVLIAQNKTHVFFRVGNWTIALPIETSARYPNVDAVIPNSAHAATTWHVAAEEAPALASVLDDLPGAKEEHSPVTIDLTGPAMIRARGGDEQRCTEVALPDSRCDGKPIRVATSRRFLQRALRLARQADPVPRRSARVRLCAARFGVDLAPAGSCHASGIARLN